MKTFYTLLIAVVTLFTGSVAGQTAGGTDWGFNGSVSAVTSDSHYVYLGGGFDYFGPPTGGGALITTDNTFPDLKFPFVKGKIYTCVSDGKGGWFIGGQFDKVGTYERQNLAHINADGSVSDWNPGPNKEINSIAVDDSAVYVAGHFSSIGGKSLNYLAKINKFTGEVEDWNPSPNHVVYTIAVTDRYLYAGGEFTKMGTANRTFLARLDKKTGEPDDTWVPNPNNLVYTIVPRGGVIYVGGAFTSFWGSGVAYYAAKLNAIDGSLVTNSFWYPNPDSYVKKIIPDGSRVYLVGDFHHVGRVHDTVVPRDYVACVDNDKGKPDLLWHPELDFFVNDVHVLNNKIYIAGVFKKVNGKDRKYLVRVDDFYGNIDNSWQPNVDGPVYCLRFDKNKIYMGGVFFSEGGLNVQNLIRLKKSDYTIDSAWKPEPNGQVSAIVTDGNDIYVGGDFTSIGNTQVKYLAKINNTNGRADKNWNPKVNSTVMSVAQSDSALFVGGYFTNVGGEANGNTFAYLAKIRKTDGHVYDSWHTDPSDGLNGNIDHVAVHGKFVYASGRFENDDRTRVINYFNRLYRSNGKKDTTWKPTTDGLVWDMAFHGNNMIVAGDFQKINSKTHKELAKINLLTGRVSDTWRPDVGMGPVETLALKDGYVYAGGDFTSIRGISNHSLMRIGCCLGIPDTAWIPKLQNTSALGLSTLRLYFSGNDLITTGYFRYVGTSPHSNFCIFRNVESPDDGQKVFALGKGPGGNHSVVVRCNGKTYAWGANDKGQLGTGTNANSNVPLAVDTSGILKGKSIVQVAMNRKRSLALDAEGHIYMWGQRDSGETKNSRLGGNPLPVAVDTTGILKGKKIIAIAAGGVFDMALDSKGKVYTWGSGIALGNGSDANSQSTSPVAVDTTGVLKGKKIVAIAAGNSHAVALDDKGLVYTWGSNAYGQLGNTSVSGSAGTPVLVDTSFYLSDKKIIAIAAGTNHTLAVALDGTAYAWGANNLGQLGNGNYNNQNTPDAVYNIGVMGGKKIIAVAGGENHSLALTDDGMVYAWGSNSKGQLGRPGRLSNVPVAVEFSGASANRHFIGIAAGNSHSLALADDGKVFSWGSNSDGQLGNNTEEGTYSTSPVEVVWPIATAVNDIPAAKGSLQLSQNYPNPFRQSTVIRYTVPATNKTSGKLSEVSLKVYDLTGREIATLVRGRKQPGTYTVPFKASGLTPGIYFYRLKTGNRMITRKMIMIQ
jgi:alpha-tubulin suppressor-like RCC1 family protein